MGEIRLGRRRIRTPAVCAAVQAPTPRSMLQLAKKAISEGADVVELRIDSLRNFGGWERVLDLDGPVILTNRSPREGGHFRGSESERVRLLVQGVSSGVECVDVEFSTPPRLAAQIREKAGHTSILLSHHDFKRTPRPARLLALAGRMARRPCDLLKIVTTACTLRDGLRILEFVVSSRDVVDRPVIAFAMGEAGMFTRFVGPIVGVPLVYAAAGKPTAPGQLSVRETVRVLSSLPRWEVED